MKAQTYFTCSIEIPICKCFVHQPRYYLLKTLYFNVLPICGKQLMHKSENTFCACEYLRHVFNLCITYAFSCLMLVPCLCLCLAYACVCLMYVSVWCLWTYNWIIVCERASEKVTEKERHGQVDLSQLCLINIENLHQSNRYGWT